MDIPLPELMEVDTDQDAATRTLARTHRHAMVSLAWTLEWDSAEAHHADRLVSQKLNLWRDIFPPPLDSALLDRPVGFETGHAFAPGELVPPYSERDCVQVPDAAFDRNKLRCYVEPRAGRFYPRGFVAGVRGIYPEEIMPFRLAAREAQGLTLDLNHPLAGRDLRLVARLLAIWEGGEEHGGRCGDIAELVTGQGPGMQARWRGRPTDFWSDLPFVRMDPSPDADFYRKPRLVHHLDSTARTQISALYGRLLPRGGRILDLMSSWVSHLPAGLMPARVDGLGLNAEELAANPLLGGHCVQDLNAQPRLPYAEASFDAAVCTASVEYLTKPLELFAEVARVLRPGARFVVTFSNRWFPPKVVKVWQDVHEFERLGLVLAYFLGAGGFAGLHTWSLRGLPRPADDKYAHRFAQSDPVYAVWGQKVS
jgi:SAM-dependent methyltransferase